MSSENYDLCTQNNLSLIIELSEVVEPSQDEIDKLSQNLEQAIDENTKLMLIKYIEKRELFTTNLLFLFIKMYTIYYSNFNLSLIFSI